MQESVQEKAKAYDEAVERAKSLLSDNQLGNSWIYKLLPELKESEDERIRKEIINFLELPHPQYDGIGTWRSHQEKWIAWLEKQDEHSDRIVEIAKSAKQRVLVTESKGVANIDWDTRSLQDAKLLMEYGLNYIKKELEKQGEQKPDDKFGPKFKVGDWVVNKYGDSWHIDSFDNKNYQVSDREGNHNYFSIANQDEMHFWTIQDAKDGDVLATENFIFIFKNIDDDNDVHYYCQYEINKHENDNQFDVALPQSLMGRVGNSISHYSPATKEQRDLLFQKMKEAGYEWSDKDRKLIKIVK